MNRRAPRRLPTFELQFKSLYHAWAYYMNGYLGWESVAAGKNCYDAQTFNDANKNNDNTQMNATDDDGTDLQPNGNDKHLNCLGGENSIPSSRRNMIIVRQEDYAYDPQGVLAKILAFATRGAFDAEENKHLVVLSSVQDPRKESDAFNLAKEMDVS